MEEVGALALTDEPRFGGERSKRMGNIKKVFVRPLWAVVFFWRWVNRLGEVLRARAPSSAQALELRSIRAQLVEDYGEDIVEKWGSLATGVEALRHDSNTATAGLNAVQVELANWRRLGGQLEALQAWAALRRARAQLSPIEPDCYGVRDGRHASWASAGRVFEAAVEAMRSAGIEHELLGTRGEGHRLVTIWVWRWFPPAEGGAWRSDPIEVAVDMAAAQIPGSATSSAITTGERNFLRTLLGIRVRSGGWEEHARLHDQARGSVRAHVHALLLHVAKDRKVSAEALLGQLFHRRPFMHSGQAGPVMFDDLTLGEVSMLWGVLAMQYGPAEDPEPPEEGEAPEDVCEAPDGPSEWGS